MVVFHFLKVDCKKYQIPQPVRIETPDKRKSNDMENHDQIKCSDMAEDLELNAIWNAFFELLLNDKKYESETKNY
jgi:hypothetical protein